ncbi:MAG: hypothetical protein AB7W59_23500, partial [Acidimicrobiia bacterium]
MKTKHNPVLAKLEGPFTAIARAMADKWDIRIIATGTELSTDGEVIRFPWNADDISSIPFAVLNGYLDHEVGHIREERSHREAGRETPLQIMRRQKNTTMRMLINVFEDIRMEIKYGVDYLGVAQNLHAANLHSVDNFRKRYGDKPDGRGAFWHTLGCAIILEARDCATDWVPEDIRPYVDLCRPEIVASRSAVWGSDSERLAERVFNKVRDAAEELLKQAAEEAAEKAKEREEQEGEEQEGEGAGDGGQGDDDESEGDTEGSQQADEDGTEDQAGDEGEGEAGEGDDEAEGGTSADDDGEDQEGSASGQDGDEGEGSEGSEGEGASEGEGHNEGDDSDGAEGEGERASKTGRGDASDAGEDSGEDTEDSTEATKGAPTQSQVDTAERTREDATEEHLMDQVGDEIKRESERQRDSGNAYIPNPDTQRLDSWQTVNKSSDAVYQHLRGQVSAQTSALRTKLARVIRTLIEARPLHDQERGRLDTTALHQLRLGNKRVFSQTTQAIELDTVVQIVIDMSGSMGSNDYEGHCSYWARLTCIALAEALDALNVPFEIIGFDNPFTLRAAPRRGFVNRSALRYHVFKTFDEKHKQVRSRLVNIRGHQDNTDGEAVYQCALRLAARPEQRKLMFVLSDGAPA